MRSSKMYFGKLLSAVLATAFVFMLAVVPCAGAVTNYANWMEENKTVLGNLPVNMAVLLGSHDAMSYTVATNNSACIGYETSSGTTIDSFCSTTDLKKAQCQKDPITAQLTAGVRYFDLRIAYQNGMYYAEHMWLGAQLFPAPASTPLIEIKNFLAANPSEVVILNVNALLSDAPGDAPGNTPGAMTPAQQQTLFSNIEQLFGSSLIPQAAAFPTFNSIWAGVGRIILINSWAPLGSPDPNVWDNTSKTQPLVNSEWQKVTTDSPQLLVGDLTVVLNKWYNNWSQYAGQMRVLQAMTTTDKKIDAAENTNSYLCNYCLPSSWWPKYKLNIIQVDDSTNSGIQRFVVQFNQSMSKIKIKHK